MAPTTAAPEGEFSEWRIRRGGGSRGSHGGGIPSSGGVRRSVTRARRRSPGCHSAEVEKVELTDTVVGLLEECHDEQERQVFTLAYVNGELRVTPRFDPGACPATITRDRVGYEVRCEMESGARTSPHASRYATPEQVAAKVHQIFGTAFLVRS